MSDFSIGFISGFVSLFVFVLVCLFVCVRLGNLSADDMEANTRAPRLPR